MKTIYQLALDAMNIDIKRYLNLLNLSNGLENMREEYLIVTDFGEALEMGNGEWGMGNGVFNLLFLFIIFNF
jgi:hypothetical protein